MSQARYRGNPETKEFHRILKIQPQCNADDIKEPVDFKRGRDAKDAGYDACAYCNTYWRSKK